MRYGVLELEKGSFRNPKNFVFYQDGRVFRAITQVGKDDYLASRKNQAFKELIKNKKLIAEKFCEQFLNPLLLYSKGLEIKQAKETRYLIFYELK